MGKNLKQQRRGKGSPRYSRPSHNFLGAVKYRTSGAAEGYVIDIVHDAARYCPVAVVKVGDRDEMLIAPAGIKVGDKVSFEGEVRSGSVSKLGAIPEGTQICNIELTPLDGGRICRAPGTFAIVMGHEKGKCIVSLPSKVQKKLSDECRATVGIVSGAGFGAKPFLKAGNKFYLAHAKGKYWPKVSGVSMNPGQHPFGGKTKPGIPKTISRNAPPGAKVGSISARRMGRKKL
jgi:large subunit ribosomal protein L2